MVFDGVMMASVAAELGATLPGARIDSIYQPARLDLLMLARKPGRTIPVFASADPRTARVHVSRADRANPVAPPAFCMLLRKRLIGARVSFARQRGLDRVLEMGFSGPYDDPPRTLVIEVMGKHSNIILVEASSGLVLDCIKHVSPAMSRVRPMHPRVEYAAPPSQGRLDPVSVSEDEFARALCHFPQESPGATCEEFLTRAFQGLGRDSAAVIAAMARVSPDRSCADLGRDERRALWGAFDQAATRIRDGNFSFWAGIDSETGGAEWISAIGPLEPEATGAARVGMKEFASAGELLDYACGPGERALTLAAASTEVSRVVSAGINRCRRKLRAQEQEIAESQKADELRRAGELIMANAARIQRGRDRASLVDYYDPELRTIEVELDPRLSPHANAQAYFSRYSRAKRGLAAARDQAARTRSELEYLEQVAATIELAEGAQDIDEIRQELVDQGYLAPPAAKRSRAAKPRRRAGPISFLVDGCEVLVGRNNRENDALTMKTARPDDLWMHARGVPGAHVIVRARPDGRVTEKAILGAAEIAAYYSRARTGSKVAVDYTARKNVRKPGGARPGMVLYVREKTLTVRPRPQVTT